jgi:hypothetical protein
VLAAHVHCGLLVGFVLAVTLRRIDEIAPRGNAEWATLPD